MGSDCERFCKIIWITWEQQVRNKSMAKALEVPLFVVISNRSRLIRYLYCLYCTFSIVRSEKPIIVICQNPSVVLTLFLLILGRVLAFKVVIDAHYGGIEAYNGSNLFQRILDYCNCQADLVIVTNEVHGLYLTRLGATAFVCPDPLPDLSEFGVKVEVTPRKVFFICSFDPDEPYQEFFKAAKELESSGFAFFVSGNYQKANIMPADYPYVKFLGFVPERAFYQHLFSSELIVDLTENKNCLVCGAYEALAAGKPTILSDQKVLKEYFTGGVVFTKNDSLSIVSAVTNAYAKRNKLKDECADWSKKNRIQMADRLSILKKKLRTI